MSHSDFRSTQVGAGSIGDINSGMDAAMSPSAISTSAPATTPANHATHQDMAPVSGQQPSAMPAERHAIPAQSAASIQNGTATFNDAAVTSAVIVDDLQIEQASHALKAMAHPLRLKILCILASSNEVSVQGLVERVGTTQSNISQHLSVLREKHVLDCRKDANKVFYRIRDERFLNVIRSVHDALH